MTKNWSVEYRVCYDFILCSGFVGHEPLNPVILVTLTMVIYNEFYNQMRTYKMTH